MNRLRVICRCTDIYFPIQFWLYCFSSFIPRFEEYYYYYYYYWNRINCNNWAILKLIVAINLHVIFNYWSPIWFIVVLNDFICDPALVWMIHRIQLNCSNLRGPLVCIRECLLVRAELSRHTTCTLKTIKYGLYANLLYIYIYCEFCTCKLTQDVQTSLFSHHIKSSFDYLLYFLVFSYKHPYWAGC
jgi:hypothetical protein